MRTKRISQYELSKKSGLSESYISEILNNKKNPTIYTLFIIAEALEVCPQDLIECNH